MNLTMLLDMAADGFGDRPVVGPLADGLTATQLRDAAQVGAGIIIEHQADSVVYLAVNGLSFPIAMFAAATAGVPLVPLNFRLGVEQLDALLANHPDALVITEPGVDQVNAGRTRMTTDDWLSHVRAGGTPTSCPAEGDVEAVVIYTSGTTSTPKGVLLRHSNLVSYVFGSVEFDASQGAETALMSVPPYHIAAVANVITSLFSGRRSIALEKFDPAEWLETIRTEGVTHALVVPTMLSRILDSGADLAVPTLRSLAYGGAPMPLAVIRRAMEVWPEIDFVNAYGLTETSSTVAVLTPEDHRAAFTSDDPFVRARLGSVGRALPGIEIEIQDFAGQPVAPGVHGRICIRGDQVSAEYAGKGRALDARGFFDSRDEGFLDEDGYLFVGGRTDDTIIRGAENIAPAEIEAVLLRHVAVADVAVVGLPDEEWGQRIVAAVVPRAGQEVDPDELRAFAKETLRSSKTPSEIVIWDELPRTETGKLVRRNVVRLFQEPAAS